jgi:hypothetical protein
LTFYIQNYLNHKIRSLKYIYENYNPDYVFVCGTDTYVNIEKLSSYLNNFNNIGFLNKDIYNNSEYFTKSFFRIEYYKTENNREDIRKDIKEMKSILIDIYYTDICCCCIFKIKIKNKIGLLIEGVSQYTDQFELLLPNYTQFKVNKVYRQTYGVVINPMNYYNSTEKFIIGDKEYDRYNKLPDDMEYTIKNITVYEVETI